MLEVDLAALPYSHHGLPGSLLDIAKHHDIPLEHACGGSCACTTCHVVVREGEQNLSDMQDDEVDRLDTAWDVTPQSRLGCQAVVSGDVVVEIPMYTRNYVQEGGAIQLGKSTRPQPEARGAAPKEEVRAMKWTDSEDIGIALVREVPGRRSADGAVHRPARARCWRWTASRTIPHASNEPKLEAIQMAWVRGVEGRPGGPGLRRD